MQYLYTLTSTPDDNYYEQFLLSITSLKIQMPDAEIVLLCDTKTKETLTDKRKEYKNFVLKTITADSPPDYSQIEISRWIKTSMRRLVEGDFLFIDCDTVITDDLSSVVKENKIFAACLDKHTYIKKHSKSDFIIQNDKKLGFSSYLSDKHFNSGVIFCADKPETHKIFNRWHELWLFSKRKNILRDQPAFNMAIHENISFFSELDGTWNCQIAFNGLPYLSDSKIIHYFSTDLVFNESPFIPANIEIFKNIKNSGSIPDNVLKLIKNSRSAFSSESQIIAGKEILFVVNSSLFQLIYLLKIKLPFLFNFLNCLCSFFKKTAKNSIIKNTKKTGKSRLYN